MNRKKIVWLSITLVMFFVSSFALLFFLPKLPLLDGISFSQAIYDDQHHLLRLTLSNDDKYRFFTPLSAVPPDFISSVLLQEDRYFYWHLGINPVALCHAAWQTYVAKSHRLGASTITMQVARMRFAIHSKHWQGKLLQILDAIRLEMHYSKAEILEAYFNLAPYGNNIEGAGAASLIYFNKPVQQLVLPEILTLTIMPQNPIHRLPQQKKFRQVREQLFARWLIQHPADKNKKKLIDLPLQVQGIHALPFSAPHFVNEILSSTTQPVVETTLNSQLQAIFEKITKNYLAGQHALGVYNAAVILVDSRNMEVKVLVGSASFFNVRIAGQIDGSLIKRSPGSTLKPFIYGLAIDQGLIHPATILKDVPHSFGSYNPENFDYDFVGPIKAKDALVLSRNVPAIALAEQLKPSLYDFLKSANIAPLKPEHYYGLSLVLGGAEVTMQELASLYAILLNEGVWRPLRKMNTGLPSLQSRRLLSPEASFLVLDMLQQRPHNGLPAISLKTGTSSGFRDAWSVGLFGPYVLVVWLGNFDNQGNPAFIGKTIATPLLIELISALVQQGGQLPLLKREIKNLNLTQVAMCKASGALPTRYCHDTELTWFIPGKSPIKTDTIYREIPIDKKTGLRTCHFDENTRFETYEFWPSDLLKIFKQAGIERRSPPFYDASCKEQLISQTGASPQMISPQGQLNYIVPTGLSQKMTVPFIATADADVTFLYWFINEHFLGKIPRDQALLWVARPGKFVVRVVDDHGRSAAQDLLVS